MKMDIPLNILELLQIQFHKVIDSRVKDLMHKNGNVYPNLKEYNGKETYHAINGMYGGFSYYIEKRVTIMYYIVIVGVEFVVEVDKNIKLQLILLI